VKVLVKYLCWPSLSIFPLTTHFTLQLQLNLALLRHPSQHFHHHSPRTTNNQQQQAAIHNIIVAIISFQLSSSSPPIIFSASCFIMKDNIQMRCLFVIGFGHLLLSSVTSFSTTHNILSRPSANRQQSSTTAMTHFAVRCIDTATDFWGRPRSRQEIVDFVSDVVFDNEYDIISSSTASLVPINEQHRRWVDVISAEPPVRRSDFMHSFHSNRDAKTILFVIMS
jgi:hypothetical protein